MKRRLHERLHPLIGEEEADALLDQISPPDPVTREWLQDRFDRIDDRFERMDDRMVTKDHFDERLERFGSKQWSQDTFYVKEHLDEKFDSLHDRNTGEMHQALRRQTHWVYGAAGFFAVVISIVDRIWG